MRIFITGSSDGVGLRTAQRLVADGHTVVLHARNAQRAKDATAACPGAAGVLVGDLSNIEEAKQLAKEANGSHRGAFDAVIHNAGVYRGQDNAISKGSGYPRLFTINTLAPYILATLMTPPRRLVFISSSMHFGGHPRLDTVPLGVSYSDSKLHNVLLAKAFGRRFAATTVSTSADPGWVPTKLGGRSAPDSLDAAVDTYLVAAGILPHVADRKADEEKNENGQYFARGRATAPLPVANDESVQEALLAKLAELSGVPVTD